MKRDVILLIMMLVLVVSVPVETEAPVIANTFDSSKSADPWNPQLDDPINDHAYGFGYVCSDPTPGTFSWYIYITSSC